MSNRLSVVAKFINLFENELQQVDKMNELLPSVLDEIHPDDSMWVKPTHMNATTLTLLHMLTMIPKIHYQLLFRPYKKKVNYDVFDNGNSTPFHWACRLDNKDAFKLLLEHGADLNLVNYDGLAPLEEMLIVNIEKNGIEILKLAMEYRTFLGDGDPSYSYFLLNFVAHPHCYNGSVSENDLVSFLEQLLKGDLNVNRHDENHDNALHYVCRNYNMTFAKVLLLAGCNYNQKNKYGKLPIDLG